jgi:hypothetical protein
MEDASISTRIRARGHDLAVHDPRRQRDLRPAARRELPHNSEHRPKVVAHATLANSTAVRQAEVTAAKRMIERAYDHLDLWPERLIADTGYGSAEMLN